MKTSLVALAAAVLVATGPAWAQVPAEGGAAMRERLVKELELKPRQRTRLDAILRELQPRFAALNGLDEAARRAERPKVMEALRVKVDEMLDEPQKMLFEQMQAQTLIDAASQVGGTHGGIAPAPAPVITQTPAPAPAPAQVAAPAQAPVATEKGAANPGGARSAARFASENQGGELRRRLVTELELSAEQTTKVDALFAEAQPRYGKLAELEGAERRRTRRQITVELLQKVREVLTPAQRVKYNALVQDAVAGGARGQQP